MNARIGIGVICGGLLPDDYRLPLDSQIVCVNATHRGKSYARNEALRQLQGCEHIFLFDDDCYPVLDGWADYLIDQDVQYMVLPDLQRSELVRSKGE